MHKFNFLNSRTFGSINTSSFRFWDNMVGWVVFAIATISYWATMEPTTSLWDCSEFIATSYKLEVGHPPGAPLYMMLARLASLFAASPEDVAMMINGMNSLVSGFTILFMFWTITHLARRIVTPGSVPTSLNSMILVLGSGVIGALSYAYTDTFWFSAVEGEVYALSSMFTALVVWLMFKWEENADSPTAMRWIILIAYLMGLSIGVHILNLLTIPALVMIFFFRRYKYDPEKPWLYLLLIIAALVVSMLILGAINGVIIPYTVALGAHFDTLMVNNFGVAPNVGMVIYVFVVFAMLGTLIFTTHKYGKRILNVSLLCVTVILIGFSSYAMMTIRANANPPMNSNDPSNPHMLLSVLNRDQYGARPLLKGVYYDAKPLPMVKQKAYGGTMVKGADGYEYIDLYDPTQNVDEDVTMWYNPETEQYVRRVAARNPVYPDNAYHYFPRMWYSGRSDGYATYVERPDTVCYDFDGNGKIGEDRDRDRRPDWPSHEMWVEPTRGEDLRFFMSYQMGDMFWRYFMWNFVGRQDDVQLEKSAAYGGTYLHGGWISGFDFIDKHVCGPQDKLPLDVQKNPAHNTYFFLPLLLGLMGLVYHLVRDWRNWLVVMLMFVMMGIALVVYFNTAPLEPRERDYVYAGAFYAFSIWIGLGVLGIGELFESLASFVVKGKEYLRDKAFTIAAVVAVIFSTSVPFVLAVENWDDHDRSGRYYARDMGWNYLMTAPENAIIVNYGDNDTFPLWYCQEVEGVRPDVKVMNLSYLDAEWYIDQMKLASNDADGVPFTIPQEKYTLTEPYVYLPEPIEIIIDKDFRREYERYSRISAELMAKTYLFKGMYDSVNMTMEAALNVLEEVHYINVAAGNYANEELRLMDLCNAIKRNNDFWDDYEQYCDNEDRKLDLYYSYAPSYIPESLPLADAIALYNSDEPMWLLVNEDNSRSRIVKVGSVIPDGFTPSATLPAKVDNPYSGEPTDYMIYAYEYTIPVDKESVLRTGLVDEKFADGIVEEVVIDIPSTVIYRSTLMIYDFIANSNWSRPLCFTQLKLMNDLGLLDYARFDGLCYTFVPVKTPYYKYSGTVGYMDIDKLYPIYMDECKPEDLNQALSFGNLADENVLADDFVRYNVRSSSLRENFSRVANGFIERGAKLMEAARWREAMDCFVKAENLLDRGLKVLPPDKLGYDYASVMPYVESYYFLGNSLYINGERGIAEEVFLKGDNLNARYIKNRAEWVNYYYNMLVENGFDAEICEHLYGYFIDMCDGAWAAYSVDSFDVVTRCGYSFDNLVDKYLRWLIMQLPENVEAEVKVANDKWEKDKDPSSNDRCYYDYIDNAKLKFLIEHANKITKCLYRTKNEQVEVLGGEQSVAYSKYLVDLMTKTGLKEYYDVKFMLEESEQPAPYVPKYSGQEVSKNVQNIVDIYVKGMESWQRSANYLKKFVDSAASRLNVLVKVEYVDDFQYLYAYSDYAEQLVNMAASKGVSLSDFDELLQRSDEEYALADEYFKMGDNRAMEYIAYCYDDMCDALRRMEHGEYSTKDATVVHVNMQEIVEVLNVSHVEAGSFEWVANPIIDSSLDYNQVSFDNLADRFFRMALNMVDATDVEESANMLAVNVAVSIYSLVPSVRVNGDTEVDAIYVDNMRKYFEHSKVVAMVEQMYEQMYE